MGIHRLSQSFVREVGRLTLAVGAIHSLCRAGDGFGTSACWIGDVDGDGKSDFAIGAPSNVNAASATGRVFVVSGATGKTIWPASQGPSAIGFGTSVARVGDLDGDRIADVAAGTHVWAPGGTPFVRLLSGKTGTVIRELHDTQSDRPHLTAFGACVTGGIDFDSDGTPDIVVGSPGGNYYLSDERVEANISGRVIVYSGKTGEVLAELKPKEPSPLFGTAIACANVADAPSIAIGDPQNTQVLVFNAIADQQPKIVDGLEVELSFGSSVALSGSGHFANLRGPALLVGSHTTSDDDCRNCGSAVLVELSSSRRVREIRGASSWESVGQHVSLGGDVNGDGFSDLAVSRGNFSDGAEEPGAVALYSGKDGARLFEMKGASKTDRFGSSVSIGDDLNADSCAEILIGAAGDDSKTTHGFVELISGRDHTVLMRLDSEKLTHTPAAK